MAPVDRPPRSIKVKVPRHNAQRIGPKLTAHIQAKASSEKQRLDLTQPDQDMLIQATDSASEWNSLLLSARAERGPQWDVGTQQFQVEEYSALYYDSTILFESAKKQMEEEFGPERPKAAPPLPPQHHAPRRERERERDFPPSPPVPQQQQQHAPVQLRDMSPHHRQQPPPGAFPPNYPPNTPMRPNPPPFSQGPPGPFFNSPRDGPPPGMRMPMGAGGGGGGMPGMSPTHPGMGGMPDYGSPQHNMGMPGRGMGMGMNMGGPGMGPGPGMNPGMGGPGMGNPGMGNPSMGNPGMGPGMGGPGMNMGGMMPSHMQRQMPPPGSRGMDDGFMH